MQLDKLKKLQSHKNWIGDETVSIYRLYKYKPRTSKRISIEATTNNAS